MEKTKEYNIGLDIGTNSVGWAVTDKFNNLVKYKGKNMWGSRLFEEGTTAKQRRVFRSTRRRYDRRRERINLCQKLFESEIIKEDPNFFMKLKESSLWKEDRQEKNHYNLFTTDKYNEKDYYKEYPTIYHLRYHLINSTKQEDIRLVYLAIHHMLKYRGNFLYENEDINVNNLNLIEKIESILKLLNEKFDYINEIELSNLNYDSIQEILIDNKKSKREKQSLLFENLNNLFEDKKVAKEFATILVGLEAKSYLILNREELKDEKLVKIKFSDAKYEDNKDEIEALLQEDFEIISNLKEVYNMIYLSSLFSGETETSISKVMIKKYEKHKADLIALKGLFKKHLSLEEYNKFFKSEDKNSYTTYIKSPKTCNYDDFKKNLQKVISTISDPLVDEISQELEKDNFLRKLNVVENSLYPYQLNKIELLKIIENQGAYYPCLKEKTDNDTYKLIRLLEFRIPYYVGPLNLNADSTGTSRSFAWLVKKNNNKITPYNFNEVVDLNKSAEKFITRMTSFCTYLINEKVIPKNSLLYTKFNVISELKQIKVNNHKLPIDVMNRAIDDLFINGKQKNITDKVFRNWLIKNKEYPFIEEITGYQQENGFANNMKVYRDFISIFGKIDKSNYDMIEKIIEWITIFEDKKILEAKLKEYYPELSKEQVNKIISRNYQGWSRLSKELLVGEKIVYIDNFEVSHTIMNLLETTDENFMQILNNKLYNFEEKINEYNYNEDDKELDIQEVISKLPGSPALKKGIYQSYKLVEEITNLMQDNPTHIFVEMARDEEAKKTRTITRSNKLLDLYKKMSSDVTSSNEYKKLTAELKENEKIETKKLYLYFLQYGKCLYSGKPININELSTCEIDHIIPRSLIKDDSFDNLALVYKEYNQRKSDGLTLDAEIINNQKKFWKCLLDNNFMTKKKYYNLCRKEYKEEDIEGFVNRQLVETRQISKHVVNLLNEVYGKETVISVYANVTKNYKEKYQLYKFRQVNNFHHAKDAYLASVIGNYLLIRYPKNKNIYIYGQYKKYFNKESKDYYARIKNGYGYVIDRMNKDYFDDNGELIIDAKSFNDKINKIYYYNDPIISRKTEIQTGAFYDENLLSRNSKLIPKKKGLNPAKYGGYNGEKKAYYMLVEYTKKKRKEIELMGVPIELYELSKTSTSKVIDEYIKKELDVTEYTLLKDNIKKYQLIKYKDQLCYVVAPTEVSNAVEFKFDREHAIKFNKVLNYICNDKYGEIEEQQIDELFEYIVRKIEINYPLFESELTKIERFCTNGYYQNLSILEKKRFILELFRMLDTTSANARLAFLNEKQTEIKFDDRVGRKGSQTIKKGVLIYKSTTGLNSSKYEFSNSSN